VSANVNIELLEATFENPPKTYYDDHKRAFREFIRAIEKGAVRAAEPDPGAATGWKVNAWVKKAILVGFRMGRVIEMTAWGDQPFFDKETYPVRKMSTLDGVRIVPGGSSIREGAYVGKGVVCMPPMYINVGAYVASGTMVDSHVLVGSCAQIGENCHLSAGVQIGGVLEPVGAMPVIIEDDVLVGGNCGVYEGTVVKRRAVLGSGTILNRSTPVYDLVNGNVLQGGQDSPLVIPEGAVVVPGSRAVQHGPGKEWGVSLYTPVIVKYRDEQTDTRVRLEEWLR
jgi:2,3,4,5-tetrahydropyridine-2,6-dicarboxylate N-succinyltransferase